MERTNAGRPRSLLPSAQPSPPPPNHIHQGPSVSSKIVSLQKRPLTAAACHKCRVGKSKCDGRRPTCRRCASKGFTCTYNRAPNETPASALRRQHGELKVKHEEVKASHNALEHVFDMIRSKSDADVHSLISLIRGGMDAEEIVRHVRDGDLLLQMHLFPETQSRFEFPWRPRMPKYLQHTANPYLKAPLHAFDSGPSPIDSPWQVQAKSTKAQFCMPVSAATIADSRLNSVRPSLFTRVSKNDKMMRTLLHDFFMSEYFWCASFHKDDFLDDMMVGGTDFCLPLLVNAILAWASYCGRTIPCNREFWNPQTLGYRFMAEARRLWDLEICSKPKLVTAQAGLLLYILYIHLGLDNAKGQFCTESLRILRIHNLTAPTISGETRSFRRSRAITAWFWLRTVSVVAYHYVHPPEMSASPAIALPDPDEDPDFYGDFLLQYPLEAELQPMQFPWTFKIMVEHGVLMHRFGMTRATGDTALRKFAAGLREWYKALPPVLSPENIVLPNHYKAHIHWLQSVIEANDQLHAHHLPTEDLFYAPPTRDEPIRMSTRIAFETIVRLYYLRHGFKTSDRFSVQYLNILAFGAIKALKFGKTPSGVPINGYPTYGDFKKDVRSTLLLATKGLNDQGKRWYMCKSVFDVVYDTMEEEDRQLLQLYGNLNINDEDESVVAATRTEHMSTQWPLDLAGSNNASIEERRLGNALQRKDASHGTKNGIN